MSTATDSERLTARDESAGALPRYAVRQYRMPAKVLHWTTAVLVLFMVTSGVAMTSLGGGAAADFLFSAHKTAGVLTLAVVLLRVVYRLAIPDLSSPREQYRRPVLHWMLYCALILMPLLGWAGASAFGSRGILFGLELPAIWPAGSEYADLLLQVHAYLAFGILALVALHIAVAMQDHLMRSRDAGESD